MDGPICMVSVMVTKQTPLYQFKTVRNSTRYDMTGALIPNHFFNYVKRRRYQSESKYSGFRPYCSCGWKSTTWHMTKALAEGEHISHARESQLLRPTLPL